MEINFRIDWWHISLLALAAGGIIIALLGYSLGGLLSAIGFGGIVAREAGPRRRGHEPTGEQPTLDDYDRPGLGDEETDPVPKANHGEARVDSSYWEGLDE